MLSIFAELLGSITSFKVAIESEARVAPIDNVSNASPPVWPVTYQFPQFENAGLHPVLLENVQRCGYAFPTPIQAYGIPAVVRNHDLIGVAQTGKSQRHTSPVPSLTMTGSGKTAAFLIPVLSKLMGKARKIAAPRPGLAGFDAATQRVRAEPLVLIVAPTRELCCQIFDEARRLCYRSLLRPCLAYGGAPAKEQVAQLMQGCDILIATPGRLLDFMSRAHLLSLSRLRYTIIDEADEMLHDDWNDEMAKIMGGGGMPFRETSCAPCADLGLDANTDGDHRYLLFSATFPKRLQKLAAKYLAGDYIHLSVGRTGSIHINVQQNVGVFTPRL
jgi:ATP-dependent RNA helicase DDX3X